MAKIAKVQEVSPRTLRPYERNAKIHGREQLEKLKDSIREFGFLSPCLIDRDMNIIAGHGRVLAAIELGLSSVPCVFIEGLTDAQRRAFILADNRLGELGEWSMELVTEELEELVAMDFDVELTGFDAPENWFHDHERFDDSREEGNDEYNAFLDKFESKKTTDDCYTPDVVYDAVADWVVSEYGVERKNFVRPFYPGGDYQAHRYRPDDIVVDNPPFSILAEILTFYKENGVRFFLFGPALTLFSSSSDSVSSLCVGVSVTYENGAEVSTSFLTNLEDASVRVRTAPTLYSAVKGANDKTLAAMRRELPKYSYPDYVITAAMVAKWSKYGIDFVLKREDSEQISALDEQKAQGKTIFGRGYLLSERAAAERAAAERAAAERAAAERAAAERWALSQREWEIVKSLGGGDNGGANDTPRAGE